MNVTLETYTPRPVSVCAKAAKTCYSGDIPENICLSHKKAITLLEKTIKSGHMSVLEHANFTFNISGVSRSLTHQLVRHRLASYSQQSQRYVKMDGGFECVIPFSILSSGLGDEFKSLMDNIATFYDKALSKNVPAEDARYVLPNACTTNIVVTMNARELFHFFEVRMCNRAQWEIRDMANQMYDECMIIAPEIFKYAGPKCWTKKCTEDKPCGCPPKRR
jgi:thymidylate synthase (FAD)